MQLCKVRCEGTFSKQLHLNSRKCNVEIRIQRNEPHWGKQRNEPHCAPPPPPHPRKRERKWKLSWDSLCTLWSVRCNNWSYFFFFNFKPNFGSFVAALLMAVILIYQQDQQFHCKFHFVCHETCRQPGVMYAFGFFKLGFKETRWNECRVRILTSLVITSWTQDILFTSFTRWS